MYLQRIATGQILHAQHRILVAAVFLQLLTEAPTDATPEDSIASVATTEESEDNPYYNTAFLNVTFKTNSGWKWDKAEVGLYGTGYIGPAYGLLIHVTSKLNPDDHTGCLYPFDSSRSDRKLPSAGTKWIALMKRGHCNFEKKVENAFKSKAVAVLVYNDRAWPSLEKMKLADIPERHISAVFIYKWKGEELIKLSQNDSNVYVHVTMAAHSSKPASINRTSVLFVSITFIVLMIISLTWLVFYYVQRFRYIRTKDKLTRKLGCAAKKSIVKNTNKSCKKQ